MVLAANMVSGTWSLSKPDGDVDVFFLMIGWNRPAVLHVLFLNGSS